MQNALPAAVNIEGYNLLPLPCEWTFDRFPIKGENRMLSEQASRFWAVGGNRMSVLYAEAEGPTLILTGEFMQDYGTFKVCYSVDAEGRLRMEGTFEFAKGRECPLRVGMRMYGDSGLHALTWLGYGPLESYANRNAGAHWGVHKARKATLLLAPYDTVRETGSVRQASRITWKHGGGRTLQWTGNQTGGLGFAALPYLPQMQVPGEPWVDELFFPVISLHAYNAPLGTRDVLESVYSWSWTFEVTSKAP